MEKPDPEKGEGLEFPEKPGADGQAEGADRPGKGPEPGGDRDVPPPKAPEPDGEPDGADGPSKAPKVFGILHIVFGGLTVVVFIGITILGLVMRHSIDRYQLDDRSRMMVEVSTELQNVPIVRINGYFITGFSILLTGLLIAAGVYLLKRRKLGRTLSLAYAVANIVYGVVEIAFHEMVIKGYYTRFLMDMSNVDPSMQSFMAKMYSLQIFALSCCCCFVYPVLILIFILPERFGKDLQ